MPKLTTGNWLTIIGLLVAGILAGAGGTVAYGRLASQVDTHTAQITRMRQCDEALADAVVELRVAVAKLTAAVEHAHEGIE